MLLGTDVRLHNAAIRNRRVDIKSREKHNKTSYLEVARDTQSAQITHK